MSFAQHLNSVPKISHSVLIDLREPNSCLLVPDSRSAAYVQRILLEDGNHTTMIRGKKDCRLSSIVIGEVLLVPGEEGAPPGTPVTVGSKIPLGRQITEQFCLPRSRIFFVDHIPRSLFVLV